jgi:3-hydroxybutyryl-CoA dehydrogenase
MSDPQLQVGVAGLGLLGRGIVASLLAGGFRVIGFTRPTSGFASAREHIQSAIDELVQHEVVLPKIAENWPQSYVEADSVQAFAICDFVIESIVEDFDAKRALFKEIENVVGPSVPIATNTSSLTITSLQRSLTRPGRFIGMHWAEPCHVTRFLEIIRGEQTDDATANAVMDLARALRKDPAMVQKDVNGFIVNRLGYAMYREACNLLENGVADVETIDRAFRNAMGLWATVAGPFRWMDLTGLRSYATAMEHMFPTLSNETGIPKVMRDLVAGGHNGIFTGRGFYEYTAEQAKFWQKLYHDRVWAITRLHEKYFPTQSTSANPYSPRKG